MSWLKFQKVVVTHHPSGRSPSEIYLEKGRPFSAHLKLENGKIGFEFAEKTPRTKKPHKAAAQR
jgi:hypothetical protein